MKTPNLPLPPDPEVDFVHLAKTIWRRKLLVVQLTGIAALAGFLISIMTPNRYTASTTLVQEIADPKLRLNGEKLSAISALAAVAGVDLNGVTNARMTAKTFSTILSSVPFREELMKTRLNLRTSDTTLTFYDYYTKTKPGQSLISQIATLPNQILSSIKGGNDSPNTSDSPTSPNVNIPQLSPNEIAVNNILDHQLSLQLHDDEFITISATLPEPHAAAQLAKSAGELLQQYVSAIQTEKARINLQFIRERHDEAKANFLKIQEELSSSSGKESLRLSAAYRLAEEVYTELTLKLEQSIIALNEQTPVFKIVNPVTVPVTHSYPNRGKIILIFAFFGLAMAMGWILGSGFIEETKTKWRKN